MITSELKNKIQLLWDRLWGGGLTNPISAIEQISYLLFMKRLEKFHPELEIEYKWSLYRDLRGVELKDKINEVFLFVQNELSNEDEPFAIEMKKAQFEISTPSLLEDAVEIIDDIFLSIENEELKNQHFQDIQGDVYEYLLKATNEAGKNGQFRTPRHIIQMMAELLQPAVITNSTKICDVTSGTSGFLVGAFQYILKENSTYKEIDEDNKLEKGLDGDKLDEDEKRKLLENTFVGFDIDSTMVRIGMMNMMMHGITKPKINHINTLSDEYEQLMQSQFEEQINIDNLANKKIQGKAKHIRKAPTKSTDAFGKEEFDFILANPPFAAKVNSKSISKNLNRVYTINNSSVKAQSLQTELLFLERIIFMLKKGGKAIVIVPEGVLFNTGKAFKKTREIILKDCDLEAVISLPNGVFNPYTTVKTSILLFTKKQFNSTTYQTKKVWFYGMKSDGYTLDTNRKKIIDDFPLPIAIEDFRTRDSKPQNDLKQNHFYVDIKKILENGMELNFSKYFEISYKTQGYEPPQKLLSQLIKLEEEIFENYNELTKILE